MSIYKLNDTTNNIINLFNSQLNIDNKKNQYNAILNINNKKNQYNAILNINNKKKIHNIKIKKNVNFYLKETLKDTPRCRIKHDKNIDPGYLHTSDCKNRVYEDSFDEVEKIKRFRMIYYELPHIMIKNIYNDFENIDKYKIKYIKSILKK